MSSYSHSTGTIIGVGGVELFFQRWAADSTKAILLIAHGLGEHSSRYSHLIDQLDGKGISVYALDHRGHGKSGGKRGHVNRFSEYTDDLHIFFQHIKHFNGAAKELGRIYDLEFFFLVAVFIIMFVNVLFFLEHEKVYRPVQMGQG